MLISEHEQDHGHEVSYSHHELEEIADIKIKKAQMNVPLISHLQLYKNNKKQTSIMETGRDSMFTQPPQAEINSKVVADNKKALKKSNSCEY